MSYTCRSVVIAVILTFLGFLRSDEANAKQITQEDYCAVSKHPRYCIELYDRIDPNTRAQAQLFPVVVAGVPATLYSINDLPTELQSLTGPVGRIAIHRRRLSAPFNDYATWCTGTVIPGNYLITAAHCIPGQVSDEYVVKATLLLGYRRRGDDRETQSYEVVGDIAGCGASVPQPALCPERGNWAYDNSVDFAVFRIAPNERGSAEDFLRAADLAPANLAPTELERRASVFVPQHPMAREMLGDYGPVADEINRGQRAHLVTTFQMSSGSPVFSVNSRTLVGVHVGEYEVCREARGSFCSNRFVTIEAIAERSPIIENLRRLAPALPNANRENEPDQASRLTTALSFQALLSSASSGDARSNWILGVKNEYALDPIERRLLGVPDYEDEPAFTKDDIQAVAYYRISADAGFAPAIVDLASFYYSGVAGPQDRQLAIQMLNQAAEQGDPRAQAWLSRLYEQEGSGVVRDFAIAAQYLRSAAEGGEPRSQYDLAYQILNTSRASQEQWDEAIALLEKASQAGYPNARYLLAEQYRDGIKVPLSLDRARGLYQQAAADGLVEAQLRLEQLGWSD